MDDDKSDDRIMKLHQVYSIFYYMLIKHELESKNGIEIIYLQDVACFRVVLENYTHLIFKPIFIDDKFN
jgi:hypothetical protein